MHNGSLGMQKTHVLGRRQPVRCLPDSGRSMAAQRRAAAELRAGHAEHVAQYPQEWRVPVDVAGPSRAIDVVKHGLWGVE
jgi:hypothetical protein